MLNVKRLHVSDEPAVFIDQIIVVLHFSSINFNFLDVILLLLLIQLEFSLGFS